MKNPLQKIALFHTPRSTKELQDYIENLPKEDHFVANLIMGMTWNLAVHLINETITAERGWL